MGSTTLDTGGKPGVLMFSGSSVTPFPSTISAHTARGSRVSAKRSQSRHDTCSHPAEHSTHQLCSSGLGSPAGVARWTHTSTFSPSPESEPWRAGRTMKFEQFSLGKGS